VEDHFIKQEEAIVHGKQKSLQFTFCFQHFLVSRGNGNYISNSPGNLSPNHDDIKRKNGSLHSTLARQNTRRFKKSFTTVIQVLLRGGCYENFHI
jgi:hypothetical protein